MVFSSLSFALVFVPAICLVLFGLARLEWTRVGILWLVAASLAFYGWADPRVLLVLVTSIAVNYLAGRWLGHEADAGEGARRRLLVAGIAFNLGLILIVKGLDDILLFANFALSARTGVYRTLPHVLPLGVAFYSLQQIAFLVDRYRGRASYPSLDRYALFVSFFGQLISGPLIYLRMLLPQLESRQIFRLRGENLAVGSTLFVLGLASKVLFGDSLGTHGDPVFLAVSQGLVPSPAEAWTAALAYSLQLYFDFSGYSCMALGLGRLVGIRLPVNFFSPYKATSIIEFWRRWHMTLSHFLRDYLYIPLGGNRRGSARRYLNLMITMFLGGIWHGLGSTFAMWGLLHGGYLLVNHLVRKSLPQERIPAGMRPVLRPLGWLVTFSSVVLAWVVFRAESFASAWVMYSAMFGLAASKAGGFGNGLIEAPIVAMVLVAISLLWVLLMPNTVEFMSRFQPAYDPYTGDVVEARPGRLRWSRGWAWGLLIGALAALSLSLLERGSEFIYSEF